MLLIIQMNMLLARMFFFFFEIIFFFFLFFSFLFFSFLFFIAVDYTDEYVTCSYVFFLKSFSFLFFSFLFFSFLSFPFIPSHISFPSPPPPFRCTHFSNFGLLYSPTTNEKWTTYRILSISLLFFVWFIVIIPFFLVVHFMKSFRMRFNLETKTEKRYRIFGSMNPPRN